jgi:DNA end-binding protein Ku
MGDVLTMATMRFHDEVVSPKDLDGDVFEEKPKKADKREVEMAKQLIESLSTSFKADKYRDEYREELLDLLERKAEGKEIVSAAGEEPEPTKAPDLMAALEESLAAVRSEDAVAKGDGKAAKAKSKSRSTTKSKSSAKSKSSSRSRNNSAATKPAAGSKSSSRKKAKA